ncbi:uncharacterized protein JCM6883_002037 [Sporobolomyces salmoneus]|uniref:uncharacterized protein n=1 Tax=Sporobolomyces salmoneus TaxID=183962 RepID=UPI00317AE9D3
MIPKKRTRFNWWTPSIPLLESHPSFSSIFSGSTLLLTIYRTFRLSYLLLTTPLHLLCIFLSFPPFSLDFSSIFDSHWTPTQKLVYPFLRRIIWALADVGDPNVLTRSTEEGYTPWWAWALEEFTVRIGRRERVEVTKERGVEMPKEVWEKGWIRQDSLVVDKTRRGIQLEPVNLFWFELKRKKRSRKDGFRAKDEGERCVMYLFGGGFVCGSPGEGSRCFKMARETGLRVVGVNYRRATSPDRAFPAALQDVLTCYFHLTLELGYKDVILAGDSAGGGLALNVLQYLTGTLYPTLTTREQNHFVLPSGLVLFSPWCDLTLDSFPDEQNRTDIILPSICENSVRAYLGEDDSRNDEKNQNRSKTNQQDLATHPWLSPSLPSSLPSLRTITTPYTPSRSSTSPSPSTSSQTPGREPLRIFLTLGTSELFYSSLLSLAQNLESLDQKAVQVETMIGKGEVHAFPLVPTWVSPEATKAWERLRVWFEG